MNIESFLPWKNREILVIGDERVMTGDGDREKDDNDDYDDRVRE